MKIAPWNVNSLRVRMPHLTDWLAANPVDAIALQETKLPDPDFPKAEIEALGLPRRVQRPEDFNGVAILTRQALEEPVSGHSGFEDEQKRVIAATLDGVRVIDVYIPNGQSVGSDKYDYKLGWSRRCRLRQEEMVRTRSSCCSAIQHRPRGSRRARSGGLGKPGAVDQAERAAFKGPASLGLAD